MCNCTPEELTDEHTTCDTSLRTDECAAGQGIVMMTFVSDRFYRFLLARSALWYLRCLYDTRGDGGARAREKYRS